VAAVRAFWTTSMQTEFPLHHAAFLLELTHDITIEVSAFSPAWAPFSAISVQMELDPQA